MIEFTYLKQPARKYTFEMPLLYKWTVQNCKGKVLNLFAGKIILNGVNETRVDLNRDMPADYYMDSYEFVLMAKEKEWLYNTVIFDPPYSMRQSREKYNGIYTSNIRKIKTEIPYIIEFGGVFIEYGYSTTGVGRTRGFQLEHICVVNHSGGHNDTLCIIERKIRNMII